MTTDYFRTLAAQCNKAAHDCSDLFAKEEFRRLASHFGAKADQLERVSMHLMEWGGDTLTQCTDR